MLYRYAVADTFRQCHFIGIFQFTAKGNTPGNSGDLYGQVSEFTTDIIDGGVARNIKIKCKNNFLDLFIFDAVYEGINSELIGTDPIQRRNHPAQYMVQAVELLGTFNSNHIPDIFYYAEDPVAPAPIGADMANRFVRNIEAGFAEFDLISHACNSFAKLCYFSFILLDEMQYQPERCFFSNAGKFCKFIHRIFQQGRRENHETK